VAKDILNEKHFYVGMPILKVTFAFNTSELQLTIFI